MNSLEQQPKFFLTPASRTILQILMEVMNFRNVSGHIKRENLLNLMALLIKQSFFLFLFLVFFFFFWDLVTRFLLTCSSPAITSWRNVAVTGGHRDVHRRMLRYSIHPT